MFKIDNDNLEKRPNNEIEPIKYKVIFVRDQNTGKTSIINRIVDNPFNDIYEMSIGIDFMSKNIRFRANDIKIQIWDSAGQEKYKGLIPSYIRNSSIVYIVYNISVLSSFNNISNWISFVRNIENPCIILIGNKLDLERAIEKNKVEELAKKEGLPYYECSAKNDTNIKYLFYSSISKLLNKSLQDNNLDILKELFLENGVKEKDEEDETEEEGKGEKGEEEEEEEEEKVELFDINNNKTEEKAINKKCSLEEHKEYDAIIYCHECKIFICNKCKNYHSKLFNNNHKIINLDNNMCKINDTFSNICQEKNHNNKLEFYCKDHNRLCCAACLCKIKIKGNGNHKDCDVCSIKKITKKKKNQLIENIKYLEELSKTIEQSINELKKNYLIINENKEKIKMMVHKIFTEIRNSINKREDELMIEVDKIYDNTFFKESLIKESEALPNKIKALIKRGNFEENEWKEKIKLPKLINECIFIENNIRDIKIIDENIKKNNSIQNLNIVFEPKEDEINNFLEKIKQFGNISIQKVVDEKLK